MLAVAGFGQRRFVGPVEQAVGILRRDDARQAEFVGEPGELHDSPGVFVGDRDVAQLAFADQFGERFQLGADRRAVALLVGLVLPLPEHRLVAFRPVQLIEVDVVGLQALQRAFDGGADVGAVDCQRAAADPVEVAAGAGDLGGNDDLFPRLPLEPAADDAFRGAAGFGAGRHRIHLGGVEEIDAVRQRVIELGVGIGFVGLLAEGHRAQADFGHA